jgi:hypothetical protein
MSLRIPAAPHLLLAWRVACWFPAFTLACSDDSDEDDHSSAASPDCKAIGVVCTHDIAGELAAECHEIYHGNSASVCAMRKQECIAHCLAAGEGGAGGADH